MSKLPPLPEGNLIGDCWIKNGVERHSINPSQGKPFATFFNGDSEQVNMAVNAASLALPHWNTFPSLERGRLLSKWSVLILENLEWLAWTEMQDTGKPISFARNVVRTAARYLEYYGGLADKIEGTSIPLSSDYIDFTLREPIGVTAHILPWNVPLGMMLRSIAPALAAGCTGVVKPAEQTPLGALQLAELALKAGIPPGVINVVNGGSEIGQALVSHPQINGITFTGSVATGIKVNQIAAQNVVPVVLELGGKSAVIACEGCDPNQVAAEVAKGIFSNTGQYCDASSRLLVNRKQRDDIIEAMIKKSEEIVVGIPEDDPTMGPLISSEQMERVLNYIKIGKETATLAVGGKKIESLGNGYFVQPTVFVDVSPSSRIAQEEIFGPVLSIIEFNDMEEAIDIANGTDYGLAAGIFSPKIDVALSLSKKLLAGTIYINEYFCGDVSLPFGGFKKSGIGRENGLETIGNYTQTKNIIARIYH